MLSRPLSAPLLAMKVSLPWVATMVVGIGDSV